MHKELANVSKKLQMLVEFTTNYVQMGVVVVVIAFAIYKLGNYLLHVKGLEWEALKRVEESRAMCKQELFVLQKLLDNSREQFEDATDQTQHALDAFNDVVDKNKRLGAYVADLEGFVKQHSGFVPHAFITKHNMKDIK